MSNPGSMSYILFEYIIQHILIPRLLDKLNQPLDHWAVQSEFPGVPNNITVEIIDFWFTPPRPNVLHHKLYDCATNLAIRSTLDSSATEEKRASSSCLFVPKSLRLENGKKDYCDLSA